MRAHNAAAPSGRRDARAGSASRDPVVGQDRARPTSDAIIPIDGPPQAGTFTDNGWPNPLQFPWHTLMRIAPLLAAFTSAAFPPTPAYAPAAAKLTAHLQKQLNAAPPT